MFQTSIEVQTGIIYSIFSVPMVNPKETGEIEYDLQDPLVAYHHNASNSFWLGSLASALTKAGEEKSARAIKMRI